GPKGSRMFALLAFKLVRYPEQRAVDHGTVVAGQVHNACLDDKPAEFDEVPRSLAALDLPCAHVMPRPLCLMPVVRRPVASKCLRYRGQPLLQIAATALERTQSRVLPMLPSLRGLSFPRAQRAPRPVPRR